MEDDDNIIRYIPIIGDVYDAFTIGYQIGQWLTDNGEDYNDKLLLDAWSCMHEASECDDFGDAANYIVQSMRIMDSIDTECLKKYQVVTMFFLTGKGLHLIALCECAMYSRDLDRLRGVGDTFKSASSALRQVSEVEKTIFTDNPDLIDKIRDLTRRELESINDSKSQWRKQFRALDKALNRWKYRVPLIIGAALLVASVTAFIICNF